MIVFAYLKNYRKKKILIPNWKHVGLTHILMKGFNSDGVLTYSDHKTPLPHHVNKPWKPTLDMG